MSHQVSHIKMSQVTHTMSDGREEAQNSAVVSHEPSNNITHMLPQRESQTLEVTQTVMESDESQVDNNPGGKQEGQNESPVLEVT